MNKSGPRFFGGNPAQGLFEHVSPLDCTTFKDFFDSQLWSPIRLRVTADEYRGLTEAEQKKVKFVRYFTPASFRNKGPKGFPKNNANVKAVNLLCIDIDPEKKKDLKTGRLAETGNFPAAPLLENPRLLFDALEGWNFALYTTLNHTPDRPRVRLVVEADNLDPELYPDAVAYLGAKLGLPFVTRESKVVSQAMFRPTVFADTDLEHNHPVIAYHWKGNAFDPSVLDGYEGGKQTARKEPDAGGFMDGLEYLTPPVHGVELEDIAEPLSKISPDCSMFDWIRCAMALRHQFPDRDDEAFELWDSWSSGGKSYEGTEKARYRWDHTSGATTNRLPTTIRTLFKLAKDAGWTNPGMAQRYFENLRTWLNTRETLEELVDRGLEQIVTTPLITSVYEDGLLKLIKSRAKNKFGLDFTPSKLAGQLKRLKANIREKQQQQEEEEKGAPAWTRGLTYVSKLETFYRTSTGEEVSRSSFDSTFGVKLLPSAKELEERGDTSRQGKFTPSIRPQDFVLNELEIPRVYDFTYDPANPDETIVSKDKKKFVNTYRKSYAKPDKAGATEAGEIIKKHAALLISEPEYQRRLLDFIAFMVQSPGKKIRWAFLIQSAQGNGKGLLAKALRGVFGRGNIKTVDPEAIFSSFNDWAYGSQLAILNEIRVTGHSRHDVMNKLKEPISDDHVSINQKFRDNREVENVTNYIMFTNHKDALAMEQRERRYFVVYSPIQTERDADRLVESGKLGPLQDLVDSGQFGGLRAFFEEWEISEDFCPDSPPPKTPYFFQMAKHAKPELETILEDLIADGSEPTVQEDLISASEFLQIVTNETKERISPKVLNSVLLCKGFRHVGRMSIAGGKHQVWVNPDSAIADLDLGQILLKRIEANGSELL